MLTDERRVHITKENSCFIVLLKDLFMEINRRGIERIVVRFRIIKSETVTFQFELQFSFIIKLLMQKQVRNVLSVAQIYASNRMIENIYIHLPFCQKKCHFCAFPIHAIGKEPNKQMMSNYISYLKQQIAVSRQYTRISPSLKSLYFGGGTPSLHTHKQIQQIMNMFPVNHQTEVTIEVNPTQIERIKQFMDIGVNRISLGIQSFNNSIVASMGRFHDNKTRNCIQKILLKHRPPNLSTDFILNFCTQQADFKQMIDFIKTVSPQHLTIYMLEINEGSKIYQQKQLLSNLPSEQKIIQTYKSLVQTLKENGYEHYQVSNFVKNGKVKSIHNATYWEGDKQFLAYGMGASSLISSNRVNRPRSLSAYYRFVQNIKNGITTQIQYSSEKTPQQILQAILMSSLRTTHGVSWQKINSILTQQQSQRIKDILNQIENQLPGIIINTNHNFSLTSPNGLLLADQICFRLTQIYN